MNTTLSHLPQKKQDDLSQLTAHIRQAVPRVVLVVLYGSYARGTWVEEDTRHDFGIETTFSSDYDLLVITDGVNVENTTFLLDNVVSRFYAKSALRKPNVEFLIESKSTFNNYISDGRYFYTEILEEGIELYRDPQYVVPMPRKLNLVEVKAQAVEYYDIWYKKAKSFLFGARIYYWIFDPKMASFMLHQCCESFYHTVELVFTSKKPRQHDLEKLIRSTKKHSELLACVFPLNTPEEKRLFRLLCDAYIQSRYNPKFQVSRRDIRALLPKVRLLKQITRRICTEKIASFDRQ